MRAGDGGGEQIPLCRIEYPGDGEDRDSPSTTCRRGLRPCPARHWRTCPDPRRRHRRDHPPRRLPDLISFTKVLKHVRRSVIRQSARTSVQIRQLMVTMAAKVRRKPGNGVRRLRQAGRCLKRPASKYSFRKAGQVRRVAAKVLTLHPTIVQLVKQRH